MNLNKEEEINIANKINSNYTINLIINNESPYTLYCAKDIGDLLNLKNIRATISNYNKDEKIMIEKRTKSGNKNINFLTIKGLIKVLAKCRKEEVIEFCNFIDLKINLNIYPCIEVETIKCIIESFNGESIIPQYRINNYVIDLYFDKYKLAIECDEHHYDIEKDTIREKIIKNYLNCTFIRYKPYLKNFNIFTVINQIYRHIKGYEKNL